MKIKCYGLKHKNYKTKECPNKHHQMFHRYNKTVVKTSTSQQMINIIRNKGNITTDITRT